MLSYLLSLLIISLRAFTIHHHGSRERQERRTKDNFLGTGLATKVSTSPVINDCINPHLSLSLHIPLVNVLAPVRKQSEVPLTHHVHPVLTFVTSPLVPLGQQQLVGVNSNTL